jgi:Aldehyde dehydrogenase family
MTWAWRSWTCICTEHAALSQQSCCVSVGLSCLIASRVPPSLRMCLAQVAEQTPLTAARYGELALEAGIPPGVLNVIQGGAPRCLWGPLCRCLISTLVVRQSAPKHSA